jgi:hypothetical protein
MSAAAFGISCWSAATACALACFGVTVMFMFLMFFVERFAEPAKDAEA